MSISNTPEVEEKNRLGIARARYSNRIRQYLDIYDAGELHELVVNAAKNKSTGAHWAIYGISHAGTRALVEAYEDMQDAERERYDALVKRGGAGEEPPQHEDILEEALRITTGDRNNAYGEPTQDFARTAKMWSAILGIEISPKQLALCMVALKISRACWSDRRDHYVDMAGYARCGYECVKTETGGAE